MSATQGQAGPDGASPVALFDETAQALRVSRARRRQDQGTPFLMSRAVSDLSERLQDVKRNFSKACLIGPFDWREPIHAALPTGKIEQFDWSPTPEGDDYDLVISLLHLQSINAVGGWMRAVRSMLIPDGLFIAALIGGSSLGDLRHALYRIDTERTGSPRPRIHPMIDVRAAAQLLGHAGLAIPVTDADRFTVHYRAIGTLVDDLRDLGLTNALTDRSKRFSRHLSTDLENALRDEAGTPIPMPWEIVWMTGWAPHESQQKPLKPGSAKTGLNAALRAIRDGS